jgi:ComF family protein
MSRLLDTILDLVFAPVCLGCAGALSTTDPQRLVCDECRARLRPLAPPLCPRCGAPRLRTGRNDGPLCGECAEWPWALRAARSACVLERPASTLVHQLKYRGWRALAEPLAARMAEVELPADVRDETNVVVPVPTTRTRRRERGYNQTELLAQAFARRTGRVVAAVLERIGGSATQTALRPMARGTNVAGAFRVRPCVEHTLRNDHILLLDDVLTTGATAAECARVLVNAGARAASIITFARALDARRWAEPWADEPLELRGFG